VVSPSETAAALHETHIGVVILLGDRAYKIKKPVRTGFLDFTTAPRRRAALQRELELNRRLAPDVYLGLCEVTDPVQPDGPSEPMLAMRRMPAERRLATLVRAGAPVDQPLRDLARLLAAFHAHAHRSALIDVQGGRDALRRRWEDNIEQTRRFRGTVLDSTEFDEAVERVGQFLDGREPLFADRVGRGHIVDGHGDLIADDIFCLDDGPRVLDCLEFDDSLRFVDTLDDIAFLAMDLERLGRPDLAERFHLAYTEFSGESAPPSLWHHYLAYRAHVRVKVTCLRHEQGQADAAESAAHHLRLCTSHLRTGTVRLALVGGLPGTGKTTVAGRLADEVGAVVLSSDRLRKELVGLNPSAPAAAAFGEGLYRPQRTDATYAELLHRAAALLGRGESVVLDASWTAKRHRDAAAHLARDVHADLVQLECRVPAGEAAQRIRDRTSSPSDATTEIADRMAQTAEPWPEATTIPTSATLSDSVSRALQTWNGSEPAAGDRDALCRRDEPRGVRGREPRRR
jgi:aminoglycoside phosphotransferase family enzyme/predicted kinase